MAVSDTSGFVTAKRAEAVVRMHDLEGLMDTNPHRVFLFALASLRDRDLRFVQFRAAARIPGEIARRADFPYAGPAVWAPAGAEDRLSGYCDRRER
jgi:hypothetical protein